jgi:bacillolysin
MNTRALSSLIILLSFSVFSQNIKNDENKTNQKLLRINTVNTTPEEAIVLFAKEYNLGKKYSYNQIASTTDKKELNHQKFQQFYNNIKVEFGTVITHSNKDGVYLVNGELYNANTLNTNPSFSKQEGLSIALQHIKATKYLWEDFEQAKIVGYNKPNGELVIFPDTNSETIHLAYKYDIYSLIPHKREEIYIDANTGEILFSNPITKHTTDHSKELNTKNIPFVKQDNNSFLTGSAVTRYSGIREIETILEGSNYILQDNTRGNGIKTFNCQNGSYQDLNFTDNDNNWSSAEFNNTNKDNAALDAHWGAEKTYDFWNNIFGRNSYDDNGAIIRSYVHYSNNYVNANWNGAFMTYGDGNNSTQPLTSIDVCGHEIGHAICSYTADLVYLNQSGAMNEGFSDIWGACIEQYGRTGSLDGTISPAVWLIGEDLSISPLRSMSNPLAFGDPNTYLGTNWYGGTADSGGVHTNSGVLNHWFYILTAGKSGTNNAPSPDTYTVTGIGMSKAAEIAYIAERDYLTPNSTFADARNATIEAASSIYCANSPEVIAVTNAWYAVNVGEQYTTVSDDVALQSISGTTLISCGLDVNSTLNIKNQGLNTISSISISYTIDNGTPVNQTWNGTLVPCDETTFPLNISGLTRGKHILTVTSSITNDGKPENNTKSVLILVNDSGTIGTVNPFTNQSDALITYNEDDSFSLWIRGVRGFGPMTSSGNTVYTTNLTGNYADQKKSYIVSQCYNLTNVSNPQISFAMKYDLEENWDIVYVQYTTDMGQNWNVLGTMGANWYNSDRTNASSGSANDCQNCPGAQWTGTNTTLNTYSYPLTSLIGQPNVIFRIVFHSDELENQLGVNIDDFVINGVLSNENFELENISVYPNPSTGVFNISLGNVKPSSIEVYDIMGKIIVTKSNVITTNNQTTLDLSSAAQGIYFIKIIEDNQQIVKRILKQ